MPIPWSINIISKTVAGVITTADAKLHLRQDLAEDDGLIDRLVLSAIETIEAKAHIAAVPQTIEMKVPRFPYGSRGCFYLPRSPVRSITSIKYLDNDAVEQTLDPSVYAFDGDASPSRLFLANSDVELWPTMEINRPDAVRIRYDAGPAATNAVSSELISAMLLLVGHWYENRQSVVVGTIAAAIPEAVSSLISMRMIPNGELGVVDG